jgi:hypothetical protein
MAFFYLWREYIPSANFREEADSGIAAHALKVNIPELTCTMRWKKIAFLKYFLEETSSQYTIITNSSSILNFKSIKNSLEHIIQTKDNIYAGPINSAHDCNFISGAFTILNRNSVKLLLENLKIMPVHLLDDVCFGTAFKKLGVDLINIDSLVIDSLLQLDNIDAVTLSEYGHFRLKSGTLKNRNDVYYKMYKDAKEKAKAAKNIAIEAYLAAEEIKLTYNLNNIDSSDSDDDSDDSSNDNDNDNDNEK